MKIDLYWVLTGYPMVGYIFYILKNNEYSSIPLDLLSNLRRQKEKRLNDIGLETLNILYSAYALTFSIQFLMKTLSTSKSKDNKMEVSTTVLITSFLLQSKNHRNGNIEKSYKLKPWRRTFPFPGYRLIKATLRKQRGFWSLLFCPPSASLSFVSSFWSHLYAERIWNLCKISIFV